MYQKLFIGFSVLILGYILLYQNIINKRVSLDDEHCMVINPLIIKRKNLYLNSMKALMDKASNADYPKINDQYIKTSEEYAFQEEKWLAKDNSMLNDMIFQHFIHKNTYKGLQLLHRLYDLELTNSKLILDIFNADPAHQNEISLTIQSNSHSIEETEKDLDRAQKYRDYRFIDKLVTVPKSRCPKENFNIPDVGSELQNILIPLPTPNLYSEGEPT